MVKVKGTAKLFLPDEDVEVPILARFADYLSPEVRAISVDDGRLLVGVSTDPEEDDTLSVAYLPLSIAGSLADCRIIQYSKLQELDRLGPGVDLSSYKDESGTTQKVAFKFNPLEKPRRLQMAWDELNLLKRLPPHPNIVPFDRVVLEDVESRVIGFTTKYIPGGTLDDIKVPFRFEWLRQLTQVVDFLNLELGIMHQDIAPRNLLIDPDTQKILLFDFDWAAHGKNSLLDGRDDVSGVVFTLYELITNGYTFHEYPPLGSKHRHGAEYLGVGLQSRAGLEAIGIPQLFERMGSHAKIRRGHGSVCQCAQPAYMAGSTNPARLQCSFRAGQDFGRGANSENWPAL